MYCKVCNNANKKPPAQQQQPQQSLPSNASKVALPVTTTSKIAAPLGQSSVNASEVGLAQQNKATVANSSLKVASQTKTGLDGYSTTPGGDHLESLVSSTTQQLPSVDIVGGADFKSDIKSPLTNATAKQQIQQLTNSTSTTNTTTTTNATTPASAIVTPIGVNSDGLLASNHMINNSRHTTTAPVNHLMNNVTNTNGSSLIASNLVLASVQQQQQQPMYGSQQGNANKLIQLFFSKIMLIECIIIE